MIGRSRFRQTLVGSLVLRSDPSRQRPVTLTLASERARLMPSISGVEQVVGEIDAPGFASRRPVRGTVQSSPIESRYDLELSDDQGRPLRLLAVRRGRLRDAFFSLSRALGTLRAADGNDVASVELRLDFRQALRMLK